MALATGEKDVDKNAEAQANKEYRELLKKRTQMVIERDKDLNKRGLPKGLDGPNYYQDIDDWFDTEVNNLKKKYEKA